MFIMLENTLNFRDVGATIDNIQPGKPLKPCLLYRCARPDTASAKDRSKLKDEHKLKTIIDFRSKTEHINATKSHANSGALPPAVPEKPGPVTTRPLKIPGITYHEISINGAAFERHLVRQLSWSRTAKVIWLMSTGYRNDAISILGRDVMQPRGLTGLGCDTLDHSTKEIKEVFEILADSQKYPVLVHCTQGKDRTGLIVMLVELLCNVSAEAVREDYAMSERELEPEMKERLVEMKKVGLDESFAGCPPDFVPEIMKHLEQKYGGVGEYLTKIGVDEEMQQAVRRILMSDPEELSP